MVSGALLGLGGATASADVQGPCDGSVTIGGTTYGPHNDTASDPIVVPAEPGLVAAWEGHTDVVIRDHRGEVGVSLGPGVVTLRTWSGENAEESQEAAGTYAIDDAREALGVDVVGLYEVVASHEGAGGSCSGSVMVRIEGSPIGTPVGAGALAATALAGVGLGFAGFGRKP